MQRIILVENRLIISIGDAGYTDAWLVRVSGHLGISWVEPHIIKPYAPSAGTLRIIVAGQANRQSGNIIAHLNLFLQIHPFIRAARELRVEGYPIDLGVVVPCLASLIHEKPKLSSWTLTVHPAG